LNEFISDLKSVLGLSALKRVGRRTLDDDCLGLAGQLAFFSLLSLFPFLMVLVGVVLLIRAEMNAVLAHIVEERKGITFARSETASN
jgi:membrane protein